MDFKNRKFNILGEPWTLQFVDKLDVEPDAEKGSFRFGETDSVLRTCKVATLDSNGKPFPKDVIEDTMVHELIHAILDSGQYLDSSRDEPMVEWLAKCLISFKKQKIQDIIK